MKKDISNYDNIIDSRDVEKRIDELEDERDSWQEDNNLPDYIDPETTTNDKIKEWADEQVEKWSEWDESDEGQELKALISLRDELEDYCPDWKYGTTLIRESYWVEYCRELVKDTDGLPDNLPSYIEDNINWDGVADDLQTDYTSGEFDGVTYWAR
jgi:hypothetical protein